MIIIINHFHYDYYYLHVCIYVYHGFYTTSACRLSPGAWFFRDSKAWPKMQHPQQPTKNLGDSGSPKSP